jgi:hypothetical protein
LLHLNRHIGLRLELRPRQLHVAGIQAHELHLRLGVVAEHEGRLRLLGADDLQRLAVASAVGIRLLERFGLETAGAAESGRGLAADHVGVGADGDDSGIAGAAGEDGQAEKKALFQSAIP